MSFRGNWQFGFVVDVIHLEQGPEDRVLEVVPSSNLTAHFREHFGLRQAGNQRQFEVLIPFGAWACHKTGRCYH